MSNTSKHESTRTRKRRFNMTLDPDLYKQAKEHCAALKLPLNTWIAQLIRIDLESAAYQANQRSTADIDIS